MIDKKKPYTDYGELMAAVRAYCLAEYQRRWSKPWDASWVTTKEHILAMRERARRGQQIWSNLQAAVVEAMNFVGDQGLEEREWVNLREIVGTVPFEAIVIHGWLQRHRQAITSLLETKDFEPILSIRSELAILLELQRIEEPATPGVLRWNYSGRPLTDEDMAIILLLISDEQSGVREKLRDEALTIENVVAMEREAINTARHRHGESKRAAKERRAQTSTKSTKPGEGRAPRATNQKRRVKANKRTK